MMDDVSGRLDEDAAEGAGGDRAASAPPADGVAHLQAAARELIAAFRSVLDVAEDLVEDPATVGAVADTFGSFVRSAARAGRQAAAEWGPGAAGGDGAASDGDGSGTTGVQRIRVVE